MDHEEKLETKNIFTVAGSTLCYLDRFIWELGEQLQTPRTPTYLMSCRPKKRRGICPVGGRR